jgi:mitosis inhibitor protein kinase SWE1
MLSAAFKAQATATPSRTVDESVPAGRGRLDKEFVVVSSLGKGEFSQVWKVKDRLHGKIWAVKAGKPYTGAKNR